MKICSIAIAVCAITLTTVSAPAAEELAVGIEPVFQEIRFNKPIVITHAGDGSDRVFIAEQEGIIWHVENKPGVKKRTKFLDMQKKVTWKQTENEEGLLGMAFHPQYKKNGQFFVYYTTTSKPHVSVISRFRVSKDDPNRADPQFEEEIMRIKQPFWNHNGGTLAFGPDGYLYIALGDGGKANDPLQSGQDLSQILGSILRIDIDNKDAGKAYAVPKDNPFVKTENAKPEIWAYGVRNIWRMAFDRKTGDLWAGDVGQNLWEEVNIIVRGGNYGWSIREGRHKFGPNGVGPRADLIEPVLEYDHKTGKSITGGVVYRGEKVPALQGMYLYADYIGSQVWALDYDRKAKKIRKNVMLKKMDQPLITFGEDEQGEVYFSSSFGNIYRFTSGS